ncbi:hypothetical protein HPB47_023882 [Ixodes persulcatus]|uniref:Uncharacterized protein n=1 Tax=Ixodes persulcatus TaxID=34615 RepID=A0AC60Q5T3_IXOPE|nr:hypothetical protein HPB47_023882 [Ixodes persulcatus]
MELPPIAPNSGLWPLEGSMVQCAVVQADVPTIGKVDAFPDSGSKLTILSQELIGTLSLLPWTKPPIAVVGGSTVVPAGTLCTRISVGPISAVVEVMDWFEAAHAELVVRPPNPTEIRHPSSGAVLLCQEKVLPRMSNAVLLHTPTFSPFAPTIPSTGGLQLEPLPDDNQPLWLALACHEGSSQPERDPPKTSSPTSFESNKTSSILSDAQIGTELQPEECILRFKMSCSDILLFLLHMTTTWDSMKEHSTPLTSFQTLYLTVGNRIGMLLMTDSSLSSKLKSS